MTVVSQSRDVAAERAAIDAEIAGKTVLMAFADTAERLADKQALKWKDAGVWQTLTWREYRAAVREVALALRAIGFQTGEFVVLLARNRPEPSIADLGTQHAGGVPVFLYNTLAPEQLAYITNHCQASIAFVQDRDALRRFELLRDQLPHVRRVVLIEGEPAPGDEWTLSWADLRALGRALGEQSPDVFDTTWRQVRPDDLAALIYTSGTTGVPKGAMISQRAVLWEAATIARMSPPRPDERAISYLPLAHATGRWVDLWSHAINGGTVHCCPDPAELFQYAVDIRPTVLSGVPRVWEKLHTALRSGIAAEPDPARRQAVEQAIDIRRQVVRLQQRGQDVPAELAAQAERAAPICQAVRARVGLDQCQRAATGAAPIDPAILEFFQALGLPITEAWGMTELTCAVTGSPYDRLRNGTIGLAMPGVEVRLAEDGELLVRSGCVMQGYYKDPEGTAATLDAEGWLHTGDLGTVDADGYYSVVGRKKELIITAGGKNIAPSNIEYLLQQHPLIGQACAIGDRRAYMTALLVLDPEMAPVWARQHGITANSLADLATHPAVQEEVQRAVDAANQHLARVEQVKRYRLLQNEWTALSGELTPTLKKRRGVILDKYAAEIEALYSSP